MSKYEDEDRWMKQWDAWYNDLMKSQIGKHDTPSRRPSRGQRELMQMQEYAMRAYKKTLGRKEPDVPENKYEKISISNTYHVVLGLRKDIAEVKRDIAEVKNAINAVAETPELLKDVVEQMNEVLKALDDIE
jgi:hypothetical protein